MKRLPLALLSSFILTTPVLADDAEGAALAGESTEEEGADETTKDGFDLVEEGKKLLETPQAENIEEAQEAQEAQEADATKEPAIAPAHSKNEVVWGGVYQRSGKTIKAGEWMGMAGGGAVVLGSVLLVSGGASVISGFGEAAGGDVSDGSNDAASGIGMVFLGIGTAYAGLASMAIGPALVAGGSIRQAKAIRSVNPEAPAPLFGYATWALWGLGFSGQAGAGTVPLLIGAYVTGGIQKGKNRLNWDMATAQRLEQSKSTFTVDLVPYNYEGNRGLALTGTF
jgi:hypothetical protein